LRSSVEKDYLKIEVSDTGYGISAENMPKLFHSFLYDQAGSQRRGLDWLFPMVSSSGIAAGSRCRAKSRKGRIFTVYLPLKTEGTEVKKAEAGH